MGHFVDLKAADGFIFPAYVAQPTGQPRGAIVVLQEIFGVNSHIRTVTDAYAADGFLAVAPSTFHRVQPGVELGYSEGDMGQGFGLKTAVETLPSPGVMQDIEAAIKYARTSSNNRKVGVLGYCWGGLLAWRSACALDGLNAAVCYYGGGMTSAEESARQPACPVLAHFGDQDHWIPLESVQGFKVAHPEIEVHVYPANHGFNCDQRGSHDATAARLARERCLAFFTKNLS